ncbi:phosphosulfolactate synthase [Paenibacillus sp. J31TS4]|uniref:phosphosulfolactate synthase n=1 Tax=Paenibacillus sp. J31TS4 TaxID=2807195 RepID=UPI001B24FD17|nr:phosphosulfolactate synthase [Paenibacillus sp. J31TS4]GIP37619.1 phosphosulfolactate synthase [Paenibacillus sp. J31TS4]
MDATSHAVWPDALLDPTGRRSRKPRTSGRTMVIDKGLGLFALRDLLDTAAAYMDMIKFGFGTPSLYTPALLRDKIRLCKERGLIVFPGGTFLEVAVANGLEADYFRTIRKLGFTAVEVSDGTIDLDRRTRTELIERGLNAGLTVYTEYGKKCWGSTIEVDALIETVKEDIRIGAELVTIEGRESGTGVGIFDENGACKDDEIRSVLARIPSPGLLLWEAPQKSQQVHLLNMLGPDLNLGNVAPQEVLALEALRRGLRSDTFHYGVDRRERKPEAEEHKAYIAGMKEPPISL